MTETAEEAFAEQAKRFLKAELKRADVTYEELAVRLNTMGVKESKSTIANKISRGAFSAFFMIAVLKAIGKERINLADI